MKELIKLGEKSVVLISKDIDEDIDMDQLLQIDYTNVYGEIITNSVFLNKIGLLRADAQAIYDSKKLETNIFESKIRRSLRRESLLNGGKIKIEDEGTIKLTESSIDEVVDANRQLQAMKKELIELKKDLEYMESLFWSAKSKDSKLNAIVPRVTPAELYNELIEGTLNTVTIKKMG